MKATMKDDRLKHKREMEKTRFAHEEKRAAEEKEKREMDVKLELVKLQMMSEKERMEHERLLYLEDKKNEQWFTSDVSKGVVSLLILLAVISA